MALANFPDPSSVTPGQVTVAPGTNSPVPKSGDPKRPDARPLQRLAEVRQAQGVSLRNVARHLHVDMATVREQEDPSHDLSLSTLYAWRQVLDVPIAELLVDSDDPLSAPVMKRARLVRLMKTVRAIIEQAGEINIQRMAQMMCDQLLEIMPELAEVTAWPSVGQYRDAKDYGQAAYRRFPDSVGRYLEDG